MSYDLTHPSPSLDAPTYVDNLTLPPPPPYVPYSQAKIPPQVTRVLAVGAIGLLLLFLFLVLSFSPR